MSRKDLPSFQTFISNSNAKLSSNFTYIFCFVLTIGLIIAIFVFPSLDFSSLSPPVSNSDTQKTTNIKTALDSIGTRPKDSFSDLTSAFKKWDWEIGCGTFKEKFKGWKVNESAVQETDGGDCSATKMDYVSVWVKAHSWIPDVLDGLYDCKCGVRCLWTQNEVLADQADVWFYQSSAPPETRRQGEPLRAFIDLEAFRTPSGNEDIFVSFHSSSDVQATYAGSTFRIHRSYHVAPKKRDDVLVYWSSSRCFQFRDEIARSFLSLVPHHSFGRCVNNVGGTDVALDFYPECQMADIPTPIWWAHLQCAMSHYKFVLAIENTWTESYVTEKLFYALDAGSVPIYFGAPNVWDFVPPNSIIDASKFNNNITELAAYVKAVAEDPVAYAEFHAWRRCGILGNYAKVRKASLDTLPCRMCEFASRKGGRNATS
ncbi:hypothetical protein LUZ60_004235 [Juncus effusus]|nr:hypothetical protein LUZ60_004235 [Juncus effusus]